MGSTCLRVDFAADDSVPCPTYGRRQDEVCPEVYEQRTGAGHACTRLMHRCECAALEARNKVTWRMTG